jgi:hypothetical protein
MHTAKVKFYTARVKDNCPSGIKFYLRATSSPVYVAIVYNELAAQVGGGKERKWLLPQECRETFYEPAYLRNTMAESVTETVSKKHNRAGERSHEKRPGVIYIRLP